MQFLAQRAARFEKFLDDHGRDADGIIYSALKADELRPWQNRDFAGKGYELWDHWAGDFAGAMNYEDSIMATGRYVDAKILKHLVVGGDKIALADAAQAVKALLAVAREGDKTEPGYLPKPYGGLRHASKSRNISTDQYEHALFAFWRFRQACPDSPLVPDIESAVIRWADYFIRHDFAFDYYGHVRIAVKQAIHVLGFYLPLMAMAHRITGNPEYRHVLTSRLAPLISKLFIIEDDSPARIAHPNIVNLNVIGLLYCWQNDICKEECRRAIGAWTRLGLKWLSADGLAYCYAEGSDSSPVAPHYIEGTNQLNFKFLQWRSNVKGAASCAIAHTLLLAHQVFPEVGWHARALDILGRFGEVLDFHFYNDPAGDRIPSEFAYMRHMLSPQHMGAWLQSYALAAGF